MSFSIELSKLVTNQLLRFVTLNPDQLAGQVENLDFWMGQVRHALAGIDGYGIRFVKLEAAQQRYNSARQNTDIEYGQANVKQPSTRPLYRIPDNKLRQARRELVEATQKFLDRCLAERLITRSAVSAVMAEFTG